MQKLLIADGSVVFASALEAALGQQFQIRSCADGNTALELLADYRPDILILNLMLPYKDGLTLLQESSFQPPMIMAITTHVSAYVQHAIAALGIDYTMIAPSVETVTARLRDLLGQYSSAASMELPDRVCLHLRLLNIPAHLDGYGQLCMALPMFAENPQMLLTKELYPEVARLWGCKDGRSVEHSIRKAIQAAWHQRDNAVWRKYFHLGPGGSIPCPSNKEFLCRLSELLNSQNYLL